MLRINKLSPIALLFPLALCFCVATPATARAGEPEYDALTNYIKQNYQAKKVGIPFLGLARFAVKIIRPAGVKSFKFTMFEHVRQASATNAKPLNLVMREVLSQEWQPLIRVRTREGQQMYVFARDAGKDIKLLIASIDENEAFVARVKLNPISLAKWMQNPEILGISLK